MTNLEAMDKLHNRLAKAFNCIYPAELNIAPRCFFFQRSFYCQFHPRKFIAEQNIALIRTCVRPTARKYNVCWNYRNSLSNKLNGSSFPRWKTLNSSIQSQSILLHLYIITFTMNRVAAQIGGHKTACEN